MGGAGARRSRRQILTSYCLFSFGFFIRSQTARCRPAGAALNCLHDRELLVLHLHQVDVERGVVRLRVERDRAGRALDADARTRSPRSSSRGRASRPSCTHSAHSMMPWYCDTAISCTILVSPKRLAHLRQELLVGRRVDFLAVVAGDQDAVAFGGRQRQVLVADAEGGRAQRDLLVHARRRPLAEERHVRAADQRGDDEGRASPAGSWRSSSRSRRRRAGRSRSSAPCPCAARRSAPPTWR